MTDFRVVLPDQPETESQRELDWERNLNRWRLSEREYGEVQWNQNLDPTVEDLDYLRTFFLIRRPLSPSALVALSPGELSSLHAAENTSSRILAALCEKCDLHWIIFKLDEDEKWHRFGRTCDFAWSRGDIVTPESDAILASTLPPRSA